MEKKVRFYSCDGGCLAIGNSSCMFNVPNGYGDGRHRVTVTESKLDVPHGAKWAGVVEGDSINVHAYDCLHNMKDVYDNIMFTLRGRYHIYVLDGDVVLLKIGGRR